MSKTIQATVKVMLSYDYCHFEVSKVIEGDPEGQGYSAPLTQKEIDEARKDCQRLADKAVGQYKTAKLEANNKANSSIERQQLEKEVAAIKAIKVEQHYTPLDKAKIKALEDYNHAVKYNYMDDEEYIL